MITLSTRSLVLALVACLAVGWWLSSSPGTEGPPDRPVLRWMMKAAKNLLWIAIVAEGPPANEPEPQLVRTRVGADGFRQLEHRGGW